MIKKKEFFFQISSFSFPFSRFNHAFHSKKVEHTINQDIFLKIDFSHFIFSLHLLFSLFLFFLFHHFRLQLNKLVIFFLLTNKKKEFKFITQAPTTIKSINDYCENFDSLFILKGNKKMNQL